MVLRVVKFLREEYATALTSAISGVSALNIPSSAYTPFNQGTSFAQTPGSIASTPFAAFPLDTSANIMPKLARQSSHFPFDSGAGDLSYDKRNVSMDSIYQTHSFGPGLSGVGSFGHQPSGISSIFELLGHKDPSTSSSSYTNPAANSMSPNNSGIQTPSTSLHASPSMESLDFNTSASRSPTHKVQSQAQMQRQPSMPLSTYPSTSTTPTFAKMEQDFSKRSASLKPVFMDAITELLEELAMVREQISQQAMEHIHSA